MTLIPELIIAVKIYDMQDEGIWYAKLIDEFNGEFTRSTVDKVYNKLHDMGVIEGNWNLTPEKKWVRKLFITEDYKDYIKKVRDSNDI